MPLRRGSSLTIVALVLALLGAVGVSHADASTTPTTTTTTATSTTEAPPQPLGDPGSWSLKFDDEFDGTSLDTTKWTALGPAYNNNNMNPSPANASVTGGDLVLRLSRAGTGSTLGSGAQVTSSPQDGAVDGFDLPVGGFMQASINFPGPGTSPGTDVYNWPTFWASSEGNSWPSNGEEDVFEGLGTATSNYHYDQSETPADTSERINSATIPGDWTNTFHTYGLYRGKTTCTVYFGGKAVATYSTHDLGGAQQIVLTAGSSDGTDSDIGSPSAVGAASEIKVDYVRAWVPS